MSPTPPVMGFSYTQGEWIVLRGGFHSPAIFLHTKKILKIQNALKAFIHAALGAIHFDRNGRSKCFRLLA